MVTDREEFNKQLQFVIEDIKARVCGGESTSPPHFQAYNMDKDIRVYTANFDKWIPGLIDCGDYYKIMYPRFGDCQKEYIDNFCWVIDEDTVFCIERPFKNRVVRLLRCLLPEHEISTIKNDVMIDGQKIGPTCQAGAIHNWGGEGNKDWSSLIYCLRWSNPEKLDEIFADEPNHQERVNTKGGITSLDKFLKISRKDFITLLENFK